MSQPPDYATPLLQASQMPTPQLGASILGGIQQGLQMQFGQAQMQRQLVLQQQLDAARQNFIQAPTPENVRALAALDPQGFSAINTAHTQLTADQQRQNLQDLSAFRGLISAGRIDDAKSLVQQRIDAEQAAGLDSSGPRMLLNTLNQDPTKAGGVADYMLAGIMGPDKWSEAFGETRAQQEEPGKIALTKAQAAEATANAAKAQADAENLKNPRPKTAVAGTDPNTGLPIYYNENAPPPGGNGSGAPVVTPDIQSFATKIQADENSTGNPAAKNPNSSATGNGQFVNATWLQMARQVRPDLAGKPDDQVLALRSDPSLSSQVTAAYAQQNAQTLSANGLPVNGTTLAMAHKLGPGGAQAVLGADENAPLKTVLPANVIAANPQLAKLTAGQYAKGIAQKFGVQAISTGGTGQADGLTGDDYLKTLPPARASVIRAIAEGRLAAPNPGSRAPGAQMLLQQVTTYDPTFDAANAKTRQATRLSFTSGKDSNEIKALNTAIGHLGNLDQKIDGLNNNGLPLNNAVAHGIAWATGTDARVKEFEIAKDAALGEVNKVFVGSAGALADREGWKKQLNAAANPDALHAVVAQMADLLRSRIEALGDKYNQGMGKSVDGITLLNPHAQRTFLTLGKTAQERATSTPPPQAVIALRQNPQLASAFDAKYGQGASGAYLGKQELLQ